MIEIKNINKCFGKFYAVKNLNLTIKDWECFGLLWKNWAWKTTTIKMLTWLTKQTSWVITFDWVNMKDYPLEIKRKLAYIPDTPYVYEKLTWMEFLFFMWYNYNLSKDEIKKRALKLIKLFNLENVIHKKTEEYSHGMRQKLILSWSLIHNPKFLIIDEPMVWLDPQSWKIVKDLIKWLTKNYWISVVLTTHQLNVAEEVCNRIWIIQSWQLKKIFEDKKEFWEKLENEFINITWWYNEEQVKDIYSFY